MESLSRCTSGADQLRSRGISVDRNCKLCGHGTETICHALFLCPTAADTWSVAGLPLPPRGLSQNSVFLNIFHLVSCIKSKECSSKLKQSIPWIMWNIWKARNAAVFERVRWDPGSILGKAEEESKEWYEANYPEMQTSIAFQESYHREASWYAPPPDRVKCNIGASWSASNNRNGASWIVGDSRGKVLMHGRRSYYAVQNLKMAELLATLWAVECMSTMHKDNIIFESSFLLARTSLLDSCQTSEVRGVVNQILENIRSFNTWSMEYVYANRNEVAKSIAASVISEGRYQSYIANNSPRWLDSLISKEAENLARTG